MENNRKEDQAMLTIYWKMHSHYDQLAYPQPPHPSSFDKRRTPPNIISHVRNVFDKLVLSQKTKTTKNHQFQYIRNW